MVLKNQELMDINGGGTGRKIGFGIFFAAIGSFIVGVVDCFLRPLKCN